MINIQNILEKNAIHMGQKETFLLVDFGVHKKKLNTKKITKLNLSFVIDISGSMSGTVKTEVRNNPIFNPQPTINPWYDKQNPINPVNPVNPFQPQWPGINPHNPNFPQPGQPWLGVVNPQQDNGLDKVQWLEQLEKKYQPVSVPVSKLEQAKDAAKKAIMQMKDGDFVSIVAFDDKAHLVCESVELNSSTKATVLNKLSMIKLGGSTNLHGGWLMGATEVAKKMSAKSINRVILLTDGQTNAGLQDPHLISKDVAGLYEKSISTTTFGIGEGFNEDLLQKMSTVGGGNFYYIDDDKKLVQMFEDEFGGLSNLCATEVRVEFKFNAGCEVIENLNEYEKVKQAYLIPNIVSNNKTYALFNLKLKTPKGAKELNVGQTIVSFKDEDGKSHKITSDIVLSVVTKKEWEEMPVNEEVKVQETLLVIAKNKISATRAIDMGNIEGAKSFLSASVAYASASGSNDARLSAEIGTINNTLSSTALGSSEGFRKDLSYQSYKTRNNK